MVLAFVGSNCSWRKLNSACASLALPHVPVAAPADLRALLWEPWIVGSFVGALYVEGLSTGSRLPVLTSWVCIILRLTFDGLAPTMRPAVLMILRGFTSLGPSLKDERPPIIPRRLCYGRSLPFPSPYEPALFQAIFSLAFYGCFRVSEHFKSEDEGM